MKILIIANSRSGSTNLMKSISSAYSLNPVFEPYLSKDTLQPIKYDDVEIKDNTVVKSLINQLPNSDYHKLIPQFDKVIFLSRKDTKAMAESLINSLYLGKQHNFNSEYKVWEQPYNPIIIDDINLNKTISFYNTYKKQLHLLATHFGMKVDYYEDLYYLKMGLNDKSIKLDMNYLSLNLKLKNQNG